jgi:hypothetical protein
MPPGGFGPAILASKWSYTHALDREATGIGKFVYIHFNIIFLSSFLVISTVFSRRLPDQRFVCICCLPTCYFIIIITTYINLYVYISRQYFFKNLQFFYIFLSFPLRRSYVNTEVFWGCQAVFIPVDTTQQPRRSEYSATQLWVPQRPREQLLLNFNNTVG